MLSYLYYTYIVYANDKYAYPNVYVLFMRLLYCFHKINIFPNIIILNLSTTFKTYDFIPCDTLCDHSHMPLHHPRKKIENKIKENKIKTKVKSRNIRVQAYYNTYSVFEKIIRKKWEKYKKNIRKFLQLYKMLINITWG